MQDLLPLPWALLFAGSPLLWWCWTTTSCYALGLCPGKRPLFKEFWVSEYVSYFCKEVGRRNDDFVDISDGRLERQCVLQNPDRDSAKAYAARTRRENLAVQMHWVVSASRNNQAPIGTFVATASSWAWTGPSGELHTIEDV
ncbi:hypothetical protein B0O99DRAFT_592361 [Bisporella sp. PMI_857]|nr:hypothetical protein B0O99DRAFT_592361 [Bisporella sp. PMI_857]